MPLWFWSALMLLNTQRSILRYTTNHYAQVISMIRKLLIPDSLLICIGCQAFITGVLTNTLALSDIVAITNLKLVPYVSSLCSIQLHSTDRLIYLNRVTPRRMLMEALLANMVLMNVSLMRMNYAQNITYPETFHRSLLVILLTKPGHSSNA